MPKFFGEAGEREPLLNSQASHHALLRTQPQALIMRLPLDIWRLIIMDLSIKDLCRLARVCVVLSIIAEDNVTWKSKALMSLLKFTTLDVINHTDADDFPGVRKKYYRNTLLAYQYASLRPPYRPNPPYEPECKPDFPQHLAWGYLLAAPFGCAMAFCLGGACCCAATLEASPALVMGIPAAVGEGLACIGNVFSLYDLASRYLADKAKYPEQLNDYKEQLKKYHFQKMIYDGMKLDTSFYYPKTLPPMQMPIEDEPIEQQRMKL